MVHFHSGKCALAVHEIFHTPDILEMNIVGSRGQEYQWPEHLWLKQEVLGSIPGGCPGLFCSSSWLTNVDEMKDLWCSSTVQLLSTQI